MIDTLLKEFEIEPDSAIHRTLDYYWIEGCKYLCFLNTELSSDSLSDTLETIGKDGESYPLSSNYLAIVVATTDEEFNPRDLYLMKSIGENVVFVLLNRRLKKVYCPNGFVFPLRFSYRKLTAKIKEILLNSIDKN